MIKCHVYFSDGTDKTFCSKINENDILKQIVTHCDKYNVITVKGEWR